MRGFGGDDSNARMSVADLLCAVEAVNRTSSDELFLTVQERGAIEKGRGQERGVHGAGHMVGEKEEKDEKEAVNGSIDTKTDIQNFNLSTFLSVLPSSTHLGSTVLYAHEVTSTQTLMFGPLSFLPCGSVFICDKQSAGKGRKSNVWESPSGCLMFTFKMSVQMCPNFALVQYLISLSLVEAIKSQEGLQAFPARIKWPNDIYVERPGLPPIKVGVIIDGYMCAYTCIYV